MNDQKIDLTESLQNDNEGCPLQEVVAQALEKFIVNFQEIKKEIKILDFEISQSKEKDKKSIFGEYVSVSYKIQFVTYNVEFFIRLLAFRKENKYQILKLDIQPQTTNIKKEIEYCCNSLQRRRNLNLMFKSLITFARFVESRRLICDLILKKDKNIKVDPNKDGGIIIVYSDEARNVKLGIFWSISCSSMHEITDVVEVYYKVIELPNKNDIINKLTMLTEPCLDFTKKYHLWKSLLDDVSEKALLYKIDKMPYCSTSKTTASNKQITKGRHASGVSVSSSDSDGPSERSLVIVLDKMSAGTSRKPVASDYQEVTEKEAVGVTILSSDSEDDPEKELVCTENLQFPPSTVAVESKEDAECSAVDIEKIDSKNQTSRMTTDILNSQSTKRKICQYVHSFSTEEAPKNGEKLGNPNETSSHTLNTQKPENKESASVITGLSESKVLSEKSIKTREKLNKSETSSKINALSEISVDYGDDPGTKDLIDLENLSKKTPGTSQQTPSTSKKLKNKGKSFTRTAPMTSKDEEALEININSPNLDSENIPDCRTARLKSKKVKNDITENNISVSSDDEYTQKESQKDLTVKRNHALLSTQQRSSRLCSVTSDTQERNNSLSLNSRLLLRTPPKSLIPVPSNSFINMPVAAIPSSSIFPNTGLILMPSIPSGFSLLNSVLPNNLLNDVLPKRAVIDNTFQRKVSLGLVPKVPVSRSPSVVEHNLVTPPKKIKTDEDLEITSVTFVVPD